MGRRFAVVVFRPWSKTKFSLPTDDGEICAPDHVGMKTIDTSQVATAIAVEDLTKRYGDVTAVDDLSFTVRPGAVTGFFGPNGAGKTTALKVIVGLSRPTAGRALINGTPIDDVEPDAGTLGVYIEPSGAHPGRSGRDHLRSLAALAGLPRTRVDEVLAIVGLEQAAGRRVGKYSMGMRQRLGLGSALLGDPEILVLDEPLNGLDPQGIRWLRTFLRERAASGRTVLLSSHLLTEAAQTVDDVVVIHKGRLVRQGRIDELGSSGGGVIVRTPMHERLATAVQRAGGRVGYQEGNGGLLIEGMDAAQVGDLAHAERVVVHEIASRGSSLEDVFFNLTEEEAS
jgi:ABC-2 type transport system ATP-binding protein